MPRRLPILCALALLSPPRAALADDFAFYHDNVLGTSMELKVDADRFETAREAESAVLAEIDRLAAIYSGYDPSSEFAKWSREPRGPVSISPELFGTLQASDRWRELSRGAFDPRAESLARPWSRAAQTGRLPADEEICQALEALSQPAWRLHPATATAERTSDAPISLNAIAKGGVVERASRAGLIEGVRGILLNIGGDLRVSGEKARTIAIVEPVAGSESIRPVARIGFATGRWRPAVGITAASRSAESGTRTSSTPGPAGRPGIAAASVIAERSEDADALAHHPSTSSSPRRGSGWSRRFPAPPADPRTPPAEVFASSRWAV
ncbi:MAG: FAD:protein FMN transferase [Isosphaeraceae bacterium]